MRILGISLHVHLRAFACPACPVAPEDGTGACPVGSANRTGAVKYDHRQKARFDFYIYDILINLASILFPEHQNYKTCTGQARPPAKQSEADGRKQGIFATRHKDPPASPKAKPMAGRHEGFYFVILF